MTATIVDVAQRCGYSKTTVSRAFTSPDMVSEKARKKIYQAAHELNYTPDAIARAMVRGRTENIGFIIYEEQYPVVLNPFYSEVFESVLQTCSKHGFSLFISADRDMRLPDGQLHIKKQLDGVILAGKSDEQMVEDLYRQNLPVVLLNNTLDMEGLVCVTSDHYGGAVLAVRHLIEKGHKRIGLLAGAFSPHVYDARYKGYRDALKETGLEMDQEIILTVESTVEAAVSAADRLFSLNEPPTALFCTNDTIGIGAVKAALRRGLRIPEDVAVVGFDDSDICSMIEPELTSVHVDKEALGRIAAEHLIRQIEGGISEKKMIEIPVSLTVRGTS